MEMNFLAFFASALTTLVTGFIWYNPKVFGTIWMREAGVTQEDLQKGSMLKIFVLTYIFSLMMTIIVSGLTIHQSGAVGMVGGPPMIESAKPSFAAFMADYGTAFRTFKHGALHGFMTGLFFAFPMLAINGLFERKSWKYIFVHAGYWILTLTIMGGIICAWA
ncbi:MULTISPECIES: DUF1761 domain-containing protein [unclassified Flavobacterium]|uniref:DUF1761 domain-containing protein n=1 Tax=unclassified Flavobacterium TaxID=196869 RepID=UPI00057F3B16|nr:MULTISPECIES: DUF1761 domain-containing protein [unclassified Flavobacterium]KIC00425.1 hypothetical protein OA93_02190 [Flavobacterium sp. KMS]KIC01526.1 hypothetical protein OA88_13545 [Flavobacterium sp. JRM]MEA9411557.1 DUF1761 domain-containing protein [Flavobacterium sp. PL02]OUL61190.1 hypothetical protein B8T70_16410 [Flavobacterium sp. AJR]